MITDITTVIMKLSTRADRHVAASAIIAPQAPMSLLALLSFANSKLVFFEHLWF